jgi:hypothetical protein
MGGLLALREIEKSRFSQAFRANRWQRFAARFPQLRNMSVLDLGGTERSWNACPIRPGSLTLINLPGLREADMTGDVIPGDACAPELLADDHYDLVYSNSVIEHVGGHYRQQQFADNVRRLGTHYWIQTPYRYFPIEPHLFMPFAHWLPDAVAVNLACHWPLGNFTGHRSRPDLMTKNILEIDLLSITAMRYAFPDSELLYERVGGMVKSVMAVR